MRFTASQRIFTDRAPLLFAVGLLLLQLTVPAQAQPVPEDLNQIRTRAAAGEPEAQNALGNAYTNGWLGLAQNHSEALVWYQRAAEQGFAPARFNLGLAYELGRGVPKDDTVAFRHYLKAAEQGFAAALFNVGNMYATGRGVRQDLFESNLWYRQAADKGVPEAQFNLGLAYESGRGVRRDEAQAAQWYRRAADRGFALAQYNLGLLLEDGRGVEKDEAAAARYYRAAAEQGLGTAQNNYGLMLHEGRGGLARNSAEALFWLTLAVENGVDPLARDTVNRTLTPEQAKESAQMLASVRAGRHSPSGHAPVATDIAGGQGAVPRLEQSTVVPADQIRLVDQLRDQVGRLASQVLAVTAEKSALEDKLAAEREARLSQQTASDSRESQALATRLHETEQEAARLRNELGVLQGKIRNADGAGSEARRLSALVRDLEQQLRQARAAAAVPADEGSALAALQQQVKKLQSENRDLERWVESLEASVRKQPAQPNDAVPAAGLATRLAETEQILAATKRALEAQLAREEKLKVENSVLTLRFQQTEELLLAQAGGGPKGAELLELKRELTTAKEQIVRLQREKDGLTNVWVDEQRALQQAQARIAALEQELAQSWKSLEAAGSMVSRSGPENALGISSTAQSQEVARLLREQANAAALLAISRQALSATQEQSEDLKSENNRLRQELAEVRSARRRSPADLKAANPEEDDLIAALRSENEQLSERLTKVQGAIEQIVEVVRHGAPAPSAENRSQPAGQFSQGNSPRYHQVTDGDSLTRISLKYYGTPDRWEEISRANNLVLADSKKLRIGQRLVIP